MSLDVTAAQWANKNQLTTTPIVISAFYWSWWLRWCRTFTVRGRVLWADGSPVPGAKVYAYELDWWWWLSEDLVGCATATATATGSFQLTFRSCCGWWPWWCWRGLRLWRLDLLLAEQPLGSRSVAPQRFQLGLDLGWLARLGRSHPSQS